LTGSFNNNADKFRQGDSSFLVKKSKETCSNLTKWHRSSNPLTSNQGNTMSAHNNKKLSIKKLVSFAGVAVASVLLSLPVLAQTTQGGGQMNNGGATDGTTGGQGLNDGGTTGVQQPGTTGTTGVQQPGTTGTTGVQQRGTTGTTGTQQMNNTGTTGSQGSGTGRTLTEETQIQRRTTTGTTTPSQPMMNTGGSMNNNGSTTTGQPMNNGGFNTNTGADADTGVRALW
jgi:hypothetical protein